MPTYEYGCEACGNTWEVVQRITENALKDCPACGKAEARRLISGGSFQLKGSGWYADGYGNAKPSTPSSSDSGGGSKSSE
jgi:putative FmdB family regulatory protein